MGKAAKEHRKKVQARNLRLKNEQRRRDKFQREFIMNLIKQEQEKGLFNNNPTLDGPVLDGPTLGSPVLDGPVLDGPVFDSNTLQVSGPTIETPSDEVTEEVSGEVVIESPEEVKTENSEN